VKYVKLGWDAQQEGDKDQALLYYYKAVQSDKTNAYAFMAAGNLLGHTEDGHTCMKAAVALFRVQGNKEGYTAAVNWLQEGDTAE
jgi:lipopolysaccharide biosynthesis regulator YciM